MKHRKAIRRRRNPVDTSTIVFAIGGAAVAFGLYEWWKSSQTPAASTQTPAQAALVRTNAQIADITAKLAAAQAANDALGAAAANDGAAALQQTLTVLNSLKASLEVA